MLGVTDAVELAWQIAADEAVHSSDASIEPLHLLIGICSMGKFLEPDVLHRTKIKASALRIVNLEWQCLAAIFVDASLDPVGVRRAARKILGHTEREGLQLTKLSRSESSRQIFDRAEQIAKGSARNVIGLAHLFAAILDSDDQPLSALLKQEGMSAVEFKTALLRAAEMQLPIESPIAPNASGGNDREKSSWGAAREVLPRISVTIDASGSPFADSEGETQNTRRLALFYELPLQFGSEVQISALLKKVLERVVEVIPGAERAALLVRDRKSDSLLLQAHLPAGEPAVSLTLAERAMLWKQGFIWNRDEKDLSPSLTEQQSEVGMYAPLLWRGNSLGVICVDKCKDRNLFSEDDLRLLVAIAHHAAMAVANHQLQEDLRQRSTLLERMLTNFSPRIRQKLLEKATHGRLTLGGEKSEVTILFSDIRGFTRMSAGMDAEDIVEMLNHYFSVLVEPIFRYDGTVDKFIGDSILAVFGSPEPDSSQHQKAVRAALEMQSGMAALNKSRSSSGRVTCEIGIGVHCGEVLHGFIGSPDRMEFTVVGDPVNRAARYCAGAQAGEVLISADVHQRVWRQVEVEACTIATKHEGDFSAFRLKCFKLSSPPLQ
jgi:adenylate cyclase